MSNDLKRCAILGTAPSWKQCPWNDPSLMILGLNDAWVLGYPRADAWFDLHPFSAFAYYDRGKALDPRAIPAGAYLRPNGHLEWLAQQKIPVYLQQAQPNWKHSITFPRDEVLAFWSKFWPWRVSRKGIASQGTDYEVSSPAWMFMWAVAQGFTEIHIYGIHLSTEWEYLQQRPNLEFLIGVASGLGVKVVLPDYVPICKSEFRYGYEPKADRALDPLKSATQWLQHEAKSLAQRKAHTPWYRFGQRATLDARAAKVNLELLDTQQMMQRERVKVA